MIIEWHQNPLKTTIKLTPDERTIFLLKAKIKDFEDAARMAAFYLDEKGKKKGRYNPKKALSWLRGRLDNKSDENDPEESMGAAMLQAVECKEHIGDCVCVPTTCDKCLGEDLLGINTIEGLSQRGRAILRGVYGMDGERKIDEVIDLLKNYQPWTTAEINSINAEKIESYAAKSRAEAQEAHEWLLHYKATKLTTNCRHSDV
jgi:hypothetical protein